MLSSRLTCQFGFLSEELHLDVLRKIPAAVVRNPETVEAKHLMAWRESLLMTFDESLWQGSISPLTLQPMCAIATPGVPSKDHKLVATVSSMPQLISGINAVLPTVLAKLSNTEPKLSPAVVRLGAFLSKEYKRKKLHISAIGIKGDDNFRTYESSSEKNGLPCPPEHILRVSEEEKVTPQELLGTPGIESVRLVLESGDCIVNRDSTAQLCHIYASAEELSRTLIEVAGLFLHYLIPIPNPQ
jgi:hypothetical protein